MPDYNFAIDLDDAVWQAIEKRAEAEGKTVEQVVAGLIRAYGREKQVGRIITYTVQRGDSLARIARKMYGDSYKYPLLWGANNLADPGKIWVGQVLIVPFAADEEPAVIESS
jgi:nucleoid-associated protein YgaU